MHTFRKLPKMTPSPKKTAMKRMFRLCLLSRKNENVGLLQIAADGLQQVNDALLSASSGPLHFSF